MKHNPSRWHVMMPKRIMAEKTLGKTLKYLGQDPDKNAWYVMKVINLLTAGEKETLIRKWLCNWMQQNSPGRSFIARVIQNTHPRVREKFVARMVASMIFRDKLALERARKKLGMVPPLTMLISPTMRCNYRCEGCCAGSYSWADDMYPEVFDRVLSEAEAMGINYITILGGEPLVYPHLFEVLENHPKSFYQIYTNASLIDQKVAEKMVEMGNIAPQISINGPRVHTDASRGKGAFDKCIRAMDNLREAGCAFGFSSLVTRQNMNVICTDEWIDFLIEKGVLCGNPV